MVDLVTPEKKGPAPTAWRQPGVAPMNIQEESRMSVPQGNTLTSALLTEQLAPHDSQADRESVRARCRAGLDAVGADLKAHGDDELTWEQLNLIAAELLAQLDAVHGLAEAAGLLEEVGASLDDTARAARSVRATLAAEVDQ
jgi:hypothetical protein